MMVPSAANTNRKEYAELEDAEAFPRLPAQSSRAENAVTLPPYGILGTLHQLGWGLLIARSFGARPFFKRRSLFFSNC